MLPTNQENHGEAASGSEAVQLVRKLKPDVVVLDLSMPGPNGLEIAAELKNVSSAKIILYSMNAGELVPEQAFAAGVAAVVSKADGMKTFISKARGVLKQAVA